MRSTLLFLGGTVFAASVSAQAYTATYLPYNAPNKTQQGQTGTNACGTESSQDSMCQNVYINSVDDFCLFAPPTLGSVGDQERVTVSYCLRSGYGTRLIPDGTLKGAHFIETPDYVQVTGIGDFSSMNIPKGDAGGELDPHGADGNGNPIGGLVFGTSFGGLQQYHEWSNFMSINEFCIRACKPGPNATKLCPHIYDTMGCLWNMPGNYDKGVFDNCQADDGEPAGLYTAKGANGKVTTSKFYQGQPATPAAHAAPASSQCQTVASVSNQPAVAPTATVLPNSAKSSISTLSKSTTTSIATITTSSGVTVVSSTISGSVVVTAVKATSTSSVPASTSTSSTQSSGNSGEMLGANLAFLSLAAIGSYFVIA